MKIHLFNLRQNETFVYEGAPREVEIYLRRALPWLNEIVLPGHLSEIVDELNETQDLDAEIEDPKAELAEYESAHTFKTETVVVDPALDAFDLNDLLDNGKVVEPTPLLKLIDAARWLSKNEDSPDPNVLTKNLDAAESLEQAALLTYGLPTTPESIKQLQKVSELILYKSEHEAVQTPENIYSVWPDGKATADALRRAFTAGQVYLVNLGGKHSKGSMVAEDPQTRQRYMIKPGDGKNSVAAGVKDSLLSQSKREAIFYKASEFFGLDSYLPATDLLIIDDHEVAVYELLPKTFENLGTAYTDKSYQLPLTLQPFLQSGVLHQWAVMDYVLGNPDRHSQNLMVNKVTKQIYLIDHGSALAGEHFNPSADKNSYIPFYLRAWSSRQFATLTPNQRIHFMPRTGTSGLLTLTGWLMALDPQKLWDLLANMGVEDPDIYVNRLKGLQSAQDQKDEAINKAWAGVNTI